MLEKVKFTGEDGDEIELYVIESTRLGAVEYVLASDVISGDGECYILKDVSEVDAAESIYEMVEDEHELDYLVNIFAELVEDVDIEF